mgnify:CR=1 FL=1
MAISTAIQKGTHVYVYDERNSLLFNRQGELMGYTSGSVTLRSASSVYTYDEKGTTISVKKP